MIDYKQANAQDYVSLQLEIIGKIFLSQIIVDIFYSSFYVPAKVTKLIHLIVTSFN
jgi:hypothetical protein